jgi:hypothetical protein
MKNLMKHVVVGGAVVMTLAAIETVQAHRGRRHRPHVGTDVRTASGLGRSAASWLGPWSSFDG